MARLEDWPTERVLRWVADWLGPVRLACSFAGESVALIDMIARVAPEVSVFTIDTGRLPDQTHVLIDEVRQRYGLTVEVLAPRQDLVQELVSTKGTFSFRDTIANRLECCEIRKVEPLFRALEGANAWVTGLRRAHSGERGSTPVAAWDAAHGLYKVNPLAHWGTDQVWSYIRDRNIPYNRLYDEGYTSVGCAPCTRPTMLGEHPRAGRWWWEQDAPKECGIHDTEAGRRYVHISPHPPSQPRSSLPEVAVKEPSIPFNRPTIEGDELLYIRQAVEGGHTSSSGPFSERAARVIQEATNASEVLMTTSCTDALEMSAMLLDLRPGDTVIVPSFTFVSTALAYVREGARILFADIEPLTLGIDPAHVAELIDDSVRAVVPVHYAGIACDLEGLGKVLERADHPIDLIEDNAHGLFGYFQDKPLGSFGRFATLSFHETKNFVSGEGGALLVNRAEDVDRARVLYDKGTNRRAFMLGEVEKYSWIDAGSSFGMSDLVAAYLVGQLEQRAAILGKRRRLFEAYQQALEPVAGQYGFTTPSIPPDANPAWHMFYVLLPDSDTRTRVLSAMREHGVNATFHYVPLHNSDGGMRFAARPTACPVTEDVSSRLLRLPFHNSMSGQDIERVVDTL
ncbi:MAG TPA: dTDP-4-amino-4,6-dideoxygalactose transaminase, partial [Acidimicrobiia bacterium]|nr:dTDP-4-amino-4,6-dideoxygalactose transaminase [Acidimicrobiia bacterium]